MRSKTKRKEIIQMQRDLEKGIDEIFYGLTEKEVRTIKNN